MAKSLALGQTLGYIDIGDVICHQHEEPDMNFTA